MDPNLCFEYQQLMSLYSHNKKSVTDKQQKQLELKKNDSQRQEQQQTKKENVSKVFENNNLNVEAVPAHVEVTKNLNNANTHNLEKTKQQQHKLNLSNLFKNQKPKSKTVTPPIAEVVAPVTEVVAPVAAPKAVAPVKINLFKALQQIKLRK